MSYEITLWCGCRLYVACHPETGVAHSRIIERRMAVWPTTAASSIPRPLAARMLAGALLESMRWWEDHRSAATPAQMDAAFHELARASLQRPR